MTADCQSPVCVLKQVFNTKEERKKESRITETERNPSSAHVMIDQLMLERFISGWRSSAKFDSLPSRPHPCRSTLPISLDVPALSKFNREIRKILSLARI